MTDVTNLDGDDLSADWIKTGSWDLPTDPAALESLFGPDWYAILSALPVWLAAPPEVRNAEMGESTAASASVAASDVALAAWKTPGGEDPLAQQMRRAAAEAVLAELARPGLLEIDAELSTEERELVESWDHDIPLLLDQARTESAAERAVRLPRALSASDLIRLAEDPDAFALDVARPIPRPPAPAARRGTAFHAWVESRFGQQPLLLPEDLPGAADDDIGSDEELRRLQEAFERSAFADRTPAAVEAPFAIVLADRVIRGRIDAVYADGPAVQLIDWKTGGRSGLHALQLAIYRVAWAEQHRLVLDDVDAAFYLVATDELIRPTQLPDRAALEAIMRGELDYQGGLE